MRTRGTGQGSEDRSTDRSVSAAVATGSTPTREGDELIAEPPDLAARVLIVDDDAALLQALPETVRTRLSYVVVETADSAKAAMERIVRVDYDAIISDIKMPGMDGLALLQEIGQRWPETPTLLITGHGEHALAVQALRGGAYDFIQKPIERDYLIASLRRAIQVRQLRRQVAVQQAALARYTQELEQHREELRRLTATLLRVQEEERRRLSCELHDDLNQKLAVLVMEVDALERQAGAGAAPRASLRALRGRVVELSDDVRGLAYRLHPSILDHLGLAIALQSYVDEFVKREKIRVTFTHRHVPETLPPDVATCLYRVVQEALRNVARHAHSARVTVRLARLDNFLQLTIKDSGVGFTPGEQRGLGLISMQERVRSVGGSLSIRSRPGYGTYLFAKVPLPPDGLEPANRIVVAGQTRRDRAQM